MGFIKIADYITPMSSGNISVDIMDYTTKTIGFMESISGIKKEKYARLKINGSCMMSETPMEHRTNYRFILNAYGDILIGGLGIGMIILPIQDSPNVKSITVIEKNLDVIKCIQHQLPFNDKVKIINEDVFDYKPERKYDCIYMDIWAYVNKDIYEEMKKLKRKYGHYLKPIEESPNRFNYCWCEYEAKNERQLL